MRFVVLVLALGSAVVLAKDEAAMAYVRKAYQAWQNAVANPAPPPKIHPDATEDLREVLAARPTVATVNRAAFGKAFAALPFEDWDAEEDEDLVREGLRLAAHHAYSEGMPEQALKAGALFAKRFADDDDVAGILGWHRPTALVILARLDEAAKEIKAHVGGLKRTLAARAWTLLGDHAAVYGDVAAALQHYQRARAFVWKDGGFDMKSVPLAERMYVRAYNVFARDALGARERHIGGKAPKLRRSVGIGPVTKALAKKRRVLVLYFFTPSDQHHFAALQQLDVLAGKLGPDKLSVVAVTWYENLRQNDGTPSMCMPKHKDDILLPKSIAVEPRNFRKELQKLRKVLGLKIPFTTIKEKDVGDWVGEEQADLMLATDNEGRVRLALRDVGVLTQMKPTFEFALLRALLAAQPAAEKKKKKDD